MQPLLAFHALQAKCAEILEGAGFQHRQKAQKVVGDQKLAADLAAGIRARGLLPVAPIDWRLNEQVMAMVADGRLGPSSCAWALPGLFLQASMHPA